MSTDHVSIALFMLLVQAVSGQTWTQGTFRNVPDERIVAATLAKAVAIKETLKVGDTVSLLGNILETSNPANIELVGTVVEAQRKGKGRDSRLVLTFENYIHSQETLGHAKVRALVASRNVKPLFAGVILDHYPCDSQAKPECVEEEENQQSMLNRLLACDGGPNGCVLLAEAHGLYGFPDFSLLPQPANSGPSLVITSSQKDIRFDQGTVFVLSRTAPAAVSGQLP